MTDFLGGLTHEVTLSEFESMNEIRNRFGNTSTSKNVRTDASSGWEPCGGTSEMNFMFSTTFTQ